MLVLEAVGTTCHWCWKANLGPLEEQEAFLMAGPFFQSLLFVLLCFETGTRLVIFLVALNRLPHRGIIRKEGFALACGFRSY